MIAAIGSPRVLSEVAVMLLTVLNIWIEAW